MKSKHWLTYPSLLLLAVLTVSCDGSIFGLGRPLPPADPKDIRAPNASLQIGGDVQTTEPGTFCWSEEVGPERSISVCADAIGIITPWEPLSTTAPVAARVLLTTQEPLTELSVQTLAVTPKDEIRSAPGGSRAWQPQEAERTVLPLDSAPQFDLELEPGLYVLSLWAQWKNGSDANYGFLLEVRPPNSPDLDKSSRLE